MNDGMKCCRKCKFITRFKEENVGWCDKRKRVVGRKTNFFTNISEDFCNFFFIDKRRK